MRTFFLGDDESQIEFFGTESHLIQTERDQIDPAKDDILFDLRDEAWDLELYTRFKNLVFINAVVGTLSNNQTPGHVVRFNGWPGMLSRPIVEATGQLHCQEKASAILDSYGKKVEWVADVPGLISPRVIAMIINEACFAEKEGVSDKNSIDIAMKLGTNYPIGPFEWADQIGWDRVSRLLQELSITGNRYIPADQLIHHR
jgi:3-hydroxybutyryl-CoA dehydrogenase